jgi:RimJ/RimL family protein N-acetyltransferase
VTQNMTFDRLNSLSDALTVRDIRNQCRTYLTNYTGYIGLPRQIFWYFTYYKKAARAGIYRIFVVRDSKNQPMGYGALHHIGNELLVTECIAEKYRGQGYGNAILKKLISIADNEKFPVTAEIWATNKISIALHKKCGFTLEATMLRSGHKLCIYRKSIR